MNDEKIIRTNIFNGEFSPSGIETARCLRRLYYTKVLGLKPKTTPAALIYGTAIHSAVEMFYTLHKTEKDKGNLKMAVIKEFVAAWERGGIIGDNKRNLEAGVLTMNSYCDAYMHDSSSFSEEDIESNQWMPMPNGTQLLVKMDRVLNRSGQIVLVDTKTTSYAISDYYFKDFENHMPTSLYFYVVRQLLGRCDSVLIDAIKVPPPPPTSKSLAFGRATFLRTELQIEDAITTYCSITDYVVASLRKEEHTWPDRFYCNQGECKAYGGCPFLGICKYGLSHPSVRVDFDMVTPERGL